MREKLFTLFMALLIASSGAFAQKRVTKEAPAKPALEVQKKLNLQEANTNENARKKANLTATKVDRKVPVYHVQMQRPTKEIFSEDFSGDTTLPPDWQNIDEAGSGEVWAFNNPGEQDIQTTTADNGFAIIDSDYYGQEGSQDAYLVTPALDFSANAAVKVKFEHYYNDYSGETAEFLYSLDSGATWNVIQDFSGTDTENASVFSQIVDVAGESNVMFAWHYAGSWGWYWAVDDISIYEPDPYAFAVNYPEGTMVSIGETMDYMVEVTNNGANYDTLDLTSAGNSTWPTEVLDTTENPITEIEVGIDATETFIVRVTVPESAASMATDTESFTITSQNDAAITESFDITTTALGPVMAPYAQGFEGDYFPPAGWSVINQDGGDNTWVQYEEPHSGDFSAAVAYETPNNDWLISNRIVVADNEFLSFYAKSTAGFLSNYLDDFNVKISKGSPVVEDFTIMLDSVIENPVEWTKYSYTLTDHEDISAGDSIYIAIQCVSNDQMRLKIDDFLLPGPNEAGIESIDKPSAPAIIGNRPVKATVTNGGTADLTSATIMWEVNGTQNQLDWTGTIPAGGSKMISLGNADFQGDSLNTISAWITSRNGDAEDAIPSNDSIYTEMNAIDAGQMWETFDGDFPPYKWSFSTPIGDFAWAQYDQDYAGYGFVMDGNFAGLLSNANGTIDTLISPKLEVDTSYVNELTFDVGGLQNASGSGGATIEVLASTDMNTWEVVHTVNLTIDETVRNEVVSLDTLHGDDYYFAFAVTNTYNNEDYITIVGIDNVKGPRYAGLNDNDLRVVDIHYPQEFVNEGENASVMVEVQNVGLLDQENVHVHLAVDGGAPMVDSIGSLAFSKTELVEFTWNAVAGRHEFMGNVVPDMDGTNDTAMIHAVAIAEGFLAEGFESLDESGAPEFPPYAWEGDEAGNWQSWNQGFTPIYEGNFAAAVGNEAGFEDVILSTRKVELTGTDEELNFYMNAGNLSVGPTDVDIVYSQDRENWTVIEDSLVPTEENLLYTVALDTITPGDYYLGFRATGTGDGSYSTWLVIDHVVGPNNVPLFDLTYNVTDTVGNVVPDAAIEITDGAMTWNATTDTTGEAMFMALEAGDYDYTVNAYSFQENVNTVSIVDADLTEHVEMVPEPLYDVTYNVKESWGSNDAIPNAVVSFTDGTTTWTDTTDVIGTVTFNDIFKQNGYIATIEADKYTMDTDTFDVVDADVTREVMLNEVMELPTDLDVTVDGPNAAFGWNGAGSGGGGGGELLELVQHSGVGDDGGYYQQYNYGYGVVFDLSTYPDAVISMADFHHVSWDVTGTWDYKIHIVDWDAQTIVDATEVLQTTGDDTWEEEINLGNIEGLGGSNVGIFIEPMSYDPEDAYPCINTDGTLDGASYLGSLDDLSTMALSTDAGDFILDLWIETAKEGKMVKAKPMEANQTTTLHSRTNGYVESGSSVLMSQYFNATKALQSYSVYLNEAEVATGITDSTYTFTGVDVGTHTAGVKGVYETGETEIATIDFEVMSSVTFTVKDEDNNLMEGATITVEGEDYPTDANGEANMMMTAGEHSYTVTHTGYDEVTGTLNVTSLTTSKTVIMTKTTYTVTFEVTDGTDPLEDAEIVIDGNMIVTDPSGIATIALPDGTYDYTATLEGYGDDQDSVTVAGEPVTESISMVGISDLAKADFSIYPNPSEGKFNLKVDGRYNVTITNTIGQVVYTNTVNHNTEIDLSNLSTGLYQITLQSDKEYGTQSIVIE